MLSHHVLVSKGLHVDYFDVFFIYYSRYSVVERIGSGRSLLDALKSCVG